MTECSATELTEWATDAIRSKLKVSNRPLVIALSGAQGSGKSTQSAMWASALRDAGHPGLVLSLDDFYLPKDERRELGRQVHPLAETRGPPGTHDTQRLISVIETLTRGEACEVSLPRFSKADDDRAGDFPETVEPLDWVIVEGWCLGISRAEENPQESRCAVYQETDNEPWRRWVQGTIEGAWHELEALFDWVIYLRISEFELIVDARWRQEETLLKTSGRSQFASRDAVRDFVSIYEPWTLRMAGAKESWADHTFDVCPGYRYREVRIPQSD